MKWFDGSELDTKELSGESLCEKLALEMYKYDRDKWLECDEPVRNALLILDFDAVCDMEGFSVPSTGDLTADTYKKMIGAFKAVGDDIDADVLAKALSLDEQYSTSLADEDNSAAFDQFNEKLSELENSLYINADNDLWNKLYEYLDEYIKQQQNAPKR